MFGFTSLLQFSGLKRSEESFFGTNSIVVIFLTLVGGFLLSKPRSRLVLAFTLPTIRLPEQASNVAHAALGRRVWSTAKLILRKAVTKK